MQMYSLFQSQWTTDGNGTQDAQHKKRVARALQRRQVNVHLTRQWTHSRWFNNVSFCFRGRIHSISRHLLSSLAIKNYSDMRLYWRNVHGYELPEEVIFKWRHANLTRTTETVIFKWRNANLTHIHPPSGRGNSVVYIDHALWALKFNEFYWKFIEKRGKACF